MNFGPQTPKIGPSFYQLSVNSAFCFISRLRTRRAANGNGPNFAKRWELNRADKCSIQLTSATCSVHIADWVVIPTILLSKSTVTQNSPFLPQRWP